MIISIPAFREEGDLILLHFDLAKYGFQSPPSVRKATLVPSPNQPFPGISIPAFREEGDLTGDLPVGVKVLFQSPPSVRKATGVTFRSIIQPLFQSPPSVRKATRPGVVRRPMVEYFNPRLP